MQGMHVRNKAQELQETIQQQGDLIRHRLQFVVDFLKNLFIVTFNHVEHPHNELVPVISVNGCLQSSLMKTGESRGENLNMNNMNYAIFD